MKIILGLIIVGIIYFFGFRGLFISFALLFVFLLYGGVWGVLYVLFVWWLYTKLKTRKRQIALLATALVLPFGDRILTNIEGYYYIYNTPKPNDDIEVSYPISLYNKADELEDIDDFIEVKSFSQSPAVYFDFLLNGITINKLAFTKNNQIYSFACDADENITKNIQKCNTEKEKIVDKIKYQVKRDEEIKKLKSCNLVEDFRNICKKYEITKNADDFEYILEKEINEGLFVRIIDLKMINQNTKELIYIKREVRGKNGYVFPVPGEYIRALEWGKEVVFDESQIYNEKLQTIFENIKDIRRTSS
ncbi:MAG: hypothetical protein MR481_02435 [Campylobacter sp.]|uniref:hypothetical protein n=1 Tax=Campylobacter sp. TaxID=205 RepID=UPI002AA962D4|nr:hypothetical protein [Campylobacter sp.]MCI7246766.1 hypothetical protein [Campylobacter sp.]